MTSNGKPRTPRYWPRMKVRGARRRQRAIWQRLARTFERLGMDASVASRHFAAAWTGATQAQQATNDMRARMAISQQMGVVYSGPVDKEALDRLGVSITEVGIGSN